MKYGLKMFEVNVKIAKQEVLPGGEPATFHEAHQNKDHKYPTPMGNSLSGKILDVLIAIKYLNIQTVGAL